MGAPAAAEMKTKEGIEASAVARARVIAIHIIDISSDSDDLSTRLHDIPVSLFINSYVNCPSPSPGSSSPFSNGFPLLPIFVLLNALRRPLIGLSFPCSTPL